MGWVVKTWRVEDELRAAEREVRRSGRIAARELADAAAHLDALEAFGIETLECARARRAAVRSQPVAAPAPQPAAVPPPVVVPEPLQVRARRGPARASMRDSPLTDLFRSSPAR
jgi:hypothetical protein